ncbi:hypothetical protein T09_13073 [Trichinella sp. T9]|nr:hypothetical protein T09_13073 [Trichinella sp. T9]KRZ82990.1 hypothetical protein T08_2164 [Trichinella sp. T8]
MSLTKTNEAKLHPHCPILSLLNRIASEPEQRSAGWSPLQTGHPLPEFAVVKVSTEVRLLLMPFRRGLRSGSEAGVLYPCLFQQES